MLVLDYDDSPFDIVDKVNVLLEDFDVKLVEDDEKNETQEASDSGKMYYKIVSK